MGLVQTTASWNRNKNPDTSPDWDKPPTFDPMIGFQNGRKERVMVATEEQMNAAQVPAKYRDYCAHHYLQMMRCNKVNFPIGNFVCGHEYHDWLSCENNDYNLRLMEYERERRLLERAKRKGTLVRGDAED